MSTNAAPLIDKDALLQQALPRFTTRELIDIQGTADPVLKPGVIAEIGIRPNIAAVLADIHGAGFLIHLKDEKSPFVGMGGTPKIANAIRSFLGVQKQITHAEIGVVNTETGELLDANQTRVEAYKKRYVSETTPVLAKLANVVTVAKTVNALAPEHNTLVAAEAKNMLDYLQRRLDLADDDNKAVVRHVTKLNMLPFADIATGTHSAPKFTSTKKLHELDYRSLASSVETAQDVLVHYAALPQLQTNQPLATAYKATFAKTKAATVQLGVVSSPAFEMLGAHIERLITQTPVPKVETPAAPKTWATSRQELMIGLNMARHEVTKRDNQSVDLPAVLMANMKAITKGTAEAGEELRDMPRGQLADLRTATTLAVKHLVARKDNDGLTNLAQAIQPYPETMHINFAAAITHYHVPVRQVHQLLGHLQTPAA